MWQPIETAPFDQDLELAVLDLDGVHSLLFPCRRAPGGWINSANKQWVNVQPTHWREWRRVTEVIRKCGLRPTETILGEAKARQSSKIRELKGALINAGLIALDEQAQALGLSRSTAWSILTNAHKASGISATIISRMLSAPGLPPLVRSKILEYVEEKTDGLYGHSVKSSRQFASRIRKHLF
jgi:hypothetical protein